VLEGRADAPVEPSQLRAAEAGGGEQRVEARAPERLVGVDVPQPGECALVEKGGFQ
jgi:hypothetical protein